MQLKSMQAEKQFSDAQHLVTNLEYSLNPTEGVPNFLGPG